MDSTPLPPVVFENVAAGDMSEAMLVEAANLFSNSYGVWGPNAEKNIGPFAKQGRRVRMSPDRLRQQVLPANANNFHARATCGGELAGHVFATRWNYEGREICWITQLCIDPKYRRHRLATGLLLKLREGKNDRGFGILSSHPAAILAALRAFGRGIEEVDLKMAREHARAIMDCSPVGYVKEAVLRGGLFKTHGEDNVVCCAYTNFWVDHTEPLEVLQAVKARGIDWPFGDLPEGCEFLVMVEGGQVNPEGERIRKQLLSSEFQWSECDF